MLYDASRHEALTGAAWSDGAAKEQIERIAADLLAAFSPQDLWPNHPLDLDPSEADLPRANLYFGAGGVIWALERLKALGAITFEQDFGPTIATLPERSHVFTDEWGMGQTSWLMGETGLLLQHWQHDRSDAVADALYANVQANLHHPALESLLGSPGSMLAALFMAEASDDARWPALFRQAVQIVWDSMTFDAELGVWQWTQDLYGRKSQYLGAAHGVVGNVFPVLRGAHLLPPDLVQGYLERTVAILARTALRDAQGRVNWPTTPYAAQNGAKLPLVQDCHGAPGIICRLAGAPAHAELDELLSAAGELVWAAGPLIKGPGLCHGTAGNGYALLKLYRRSDDEQWLERARAFAMHAALQGEQMAAKYGRRRYTLWNGDPGLALFLQSCRDADAAFPTLDCF
ncbi:lanthionine synthetase C family protein [Roseateles toxinivorans]|uniref:Lanthionine synthetase-like protein n=1 Tax=Roseateles toxinivorans TaxID=270368 RepID=A0A4R6QSG4_9BURK|nr:LanC-like protein [Roseateles toxinivorans]TDP74474.1 lanthionine synthetase-like protein [Roseateles toxinivorans]